MENPTVAEFWQQQPFAYFETYSFNRGPASAAERERLGREITAAKEALATGRYVVHVRLRNQLRELEAQMRSDEYNVVLPKDAPDLFAAHKVAAPASDSLEAQQLADLMRSATNQEGFVGCPPIYRDALVFYDAEGKQVRVLSICFECLAMATDDRQMVEANFATYDALKQLLKQWGHPIADDYHPLEES